jgi:hypothetical protein
MRLSFIPLEPFKQHVSTIVCLSIPLFYILVFYNIDKSFSLFFPHVRL